MSPDLLTLFLLTNPQIQQPSLLDPKWQMFSQFATQMVKEACVCEEKPSSKIYNEPDMAELIVIEKLYRDPPKIEVIIDPYAAPEPDYAAPEPDYAAPEPDYADFEADDDY